MPALFRPTTPLCTTHGTTCTCSHVTTPTAYLRVHPSPCHKLVKGLGAHVSVQGETPWSSCVLTGTQTRPRQHVRQARVAHASLLALTSRPDPTRPLMQPPRHNGLAGLQSPPRELRSASPMGVPVSSPKSQEKIQLLCPQAGIVGTERQRSLDAWVSAGASSQPASGDKPLHLETVTDNDSPVCL